MVLKKKLEYRFNGFQVPTIPRGPRSSRRRVPNEKKSEDNQISAFELLASLAGKLLQESESSASSNASGHNSQAAFVKDEIKQEIQFNEQLIKDENFGHGSSEESAFASEISSASIDKKFLNVTVERPSNKLGCVQKPRDDVKPIICDTKPVLQNYPTKVENGIREWKKGNRLEPAGLTTANTCSSDDSMELRVEFSSMVNLDNDVKLSLRETVPNASFSRHRSDTKVVNRDLDDDENFSRRGKSSIKVKAFRPSTRVRDHRIRKLLTSKYWKTLPELRDCEGYRSDRGRKTLYNKRKNSYQHDRCHYETLNKRRKLFDRNAVISSDGGFSSESVTNSPEKGKKGDKCGSNNGMFHRASMVSPSIISRQSSYRSKDSHVKLSIKSFEIPELFIEVPETATVGSLKRTVMEAITAILGGGLRVGVHLEGENIRDDNITLSQTGLSCKDNLDTLGFTLEPNTTHSGQACPSLMFDTPELLARPLISAPVLDLEISDDLPELTPAVVKSPLTVETNHELVSSQTDSLPNGTITDSQALVVASPMSLAALTVVPATPKSSRKCSDLVQRRTRRPFSVTEVEALVHAVEELGTGRWRDVKLRAFEDADHRTYVDLKDKWKTLVHTATIAPQQRRGEPVPQELLDRVLAAHSFWSQNQAKQHGKLQGNASPVKVAGASADGQTESAAEEGNNTSS